MQWRSASYIISNIAFSFVGHITIICHFDNYSLKKTGRLRYYILPRIWIIKLQNMFGHDILYELYEVLRLNKRKCLELSHVSGSRIFSQWGLGLSGSVGVGITDYQLSTGLLSPKLLWELPTDASADITSCFWNLHLNGKVLCYINVLILSIGPCLIPTSRPDSHPYRMKNTIVA